MPAGNTVRPQKWTNVKDLYDDGDFSIISGNYDGAPKKCLGVRWNNGGKAGVGYPNLFGKPQWFILPDFFKNIILSGNSCEENNDSEDNSKEDYEEKYEKIFAGLGDGKMAEAGGSRIRELDIENQYNVKLNK